jgi:hypothetical protein
MVLTEMYQYKALEIAKEIRIQGFNAESLGWLMKFS